MKTKKIKLGELFEVEGQMYIITVPTTPTEGMNENNQMVFTVGVLSE